MDSPFWIVLAASALLVGAAVAAMAIGVMFRRPCLRGSCGGPALKDAQGESLSCVTCPNRGKHRASSATSHSERRIEDVVRPSR